MLQREPRRRWQAVQYGAAGALAAITATTGALAYARYIEPRTLLVRYHELELPTLPGDLDGLKLAFLSDFHVGGPGVIPVVVQHAFDTLERLSPDLILLGGDYYDDGIRRGVEPDWSRLPEIAPTYAVLGNHDYNFGPDATRDIHRTLTEDGITMLRNDGVRAQVRGVPVDLIGVDDPYTGRDGFETATKQLDGRSHPRILLAHAGLLADRLPVGAADLILSGHTHGAQVRFSPFRHTSPLDVFWWLDWLNAKPLSPYRQGLFYIRGSLLYVGNGLGMTTLGLRFMAPPEIALFTLRHGKGNQDIECDNPDRYVVSKGTERLSVRVDQETTPLVTGPDPQAAQRAPATRHDTRTLERSSQATRVPDGDSRS